MSITEKKRKYLTDNFIQVYEGVISKETCEYFINFFEHQDKLGNTFPGYTGGGLNKEVKDTDDLNLKYGSKTLDDRYRGKVYYSSEHMKYLNRYDFNVKDKFEEYIKFYHSHDCRFSEPLKDGVSLYNSNPELSMNSPLMHRYKPPEQGYHGWHCDWAISNQRTVMRMMVGMVYLNDVKEGGETEFLHQKVKIQPTQGTLVIWPTYFTHIHRGNKPISNTKYVVNQWFIPIV